MKNEKLNSTAEFYTVLGSINKNSDINIRVIPLTKARQKDSVWIYPSGEGNRQVPVSDLNKMIPDTNPKSIYKYRVFCLKADIDSMVEMVKSIHTGTTVVEAIVSEKVVTPSAVKSIPAESAQLTTLVVKESLTSVTGRKFSKVEQEDIDTVAAILDGHKEKFAIIYKRYYPIILQSYVVKVKFDRALAEDLVADLFIKVFNSLDKYTIQYTFNSWITRVAKNFILDYFRKKKLEIVSIDAGISSEKMKNEDAESVTADVYDESENPEEVIMTKEKFSCLEQAIEMLDSNSREVVKKLYFEDMSYTEIAEEMNLPLGTLKNMIFRSKMKLKNILEANKQSMVVVMD